MSTDDSEMYRDWILNVIDQLRKRKARPDIERISHFIERKYGRKRSQTEMHIEKLVDMGIVIKVVYKRGTSYRNASKSRKHRYISNVLNSNIASRKITEAVSSILRERRTNGGSSALNSVTEDNEDEILVVDEDGAGVSGREIESWLSSRLDDEDVEPFLCPIRVVIQREVDAGRILRLENGNFALRHTSDHATKTTNSIPATTTNTKEKSIEPPPRPQLHKSMSVVAKRGRPPKRKLNPVVRSLSCNDARPLPTRPESEVAAVPVMPPHLCDFCQQSAECNKKDQEEELLFCKDCNAKAHPSCMQYSPELANRARNTAWQCIDCKTCCICSDPGEADCMLFCDACDKGYHMMCHVPEVDDKPQGKWICNECELAGVDVDDIEENNNIVDSTVRSTDSESTSGQRISDSRDGYSLPKYRRESMSPPFVKIPKKEFDEDYPNASEWTTQDVVNFFQKKGFEEDEANTFKEQEIDGQSLLLLKRSDVLQGLSLKLGPALKIYNHVMKLQTFEQPMS